MLLEKVEYMEKVFIFLFFFLMKKILMDNLEGQSREERDPDLEVEEDTRLWGNRKKHWKDMLEENNV